MTISPYVQSFLLHLLKFVGLSAAVAVVAALIQVVSGFDTSSLPAEAQGFAVVLIPLVVSAMKAAEAELAVKAAQAQTAEAQAKLAAVTKSVK